MPFSITKFGTFDGNSIHVAVYTCWLKVPKIRVVLTELTDRSCFGDDSDHFQQIRPDSVTVKTSLTSPSSTPNKTMSRIPTYLVYFFKFCPEIVRFCVQKVDRSAILLSRMADANGDCLLAISHNALKIAWNFVFRPLNHDCTIRINW